MHPGWVVVTGGNSGIGFETCKRLAAAGHNVILCSRNHAKGESAVQQILQAVPGAKVELMILDLSDMDSVRRFVSEINYSARQVAVLINNAATAPGFSDTTRHSIGPQNWEVTMTTNHLGPFLLTNLLIPSLKKYAKEHGEGRVVVVTSSLTERKSPKSFDVADIMYEQSGSYANGGEAYKNSKSANIMFAFELARRLNDTGVVVNCVCPGFIPGTELDRNNGTWIRWIVKNIVGGFSGTKILRIPAVTVDVGAERILDLAVRDIGKGVSGVYFKHGSPAESAENTRDEQKQRQLWDVSARLTGLN